ncbi:acyltransferase [Aquirufa sp. LEPPI-3A]|uniref:acyltransferase family protein n=1 Tax=Aquirufa regiilacus TaxID=3024868 RepID=UPI0028DEEB7C|nr:acyltransferase [Aquirufa sp. LEPPI-3A]MDT8886878.1 acyltransferase [Aquirufa sp. LEPPI-3A]
MTGKKELYFHQLNGIRFIAVMLVLLDHWLIPINPFSFFGHLGVVIFFVLSGFLITRILFENADDCGKNHSSPTAKIIRFIYRRSLRIFPIYFLLMFIGLVLGLSNMRNLWPYLFFYLPNIYIMLKGTWLGIWDHLWSLAVEEQYYLVFPYFILLLSPKRYPWLFIAMLFIGIGTRLGFSLYASHDMKENNWMWWYVNPFSAVDCFGLGGVLAYLYHYKQTYFQSIKFLKLGLLISVLLFVGVLNLAKMSEFPHDNVWSIVFERFSGAIVALFFIALCIRTDTWELSSFLQGKVISYLGKISYGLYLYHNIVMNYYHNQGNTIWYYLTSHLPDFHLELVNFTAYKFLICLSLLIGISSLSWFLVEKPINKYKNRI